MGQVKAWWATSGLFFTYWVAVLGEAENVFTNLWVAKIEGGTSEAQRIAQNTGFTFRRQATTLEDHYVFSWDSHPAKSSIDGSQQTEILLRHKQVKWAKQQKIIKLALEPVLFVDVDPIPSSNRIEQQGNQGNLSKLGTFSTRPNPNLRPSTSKTKGLRPEWKSAYTNMFNDPYWKQQWYMHDYRTEESAVLDLNVVPVYKMNYTGRGVTVAIVDVGVNRNSTDIKENYVDDLAYDYLEFAPSAIPTEGLGMATRHGTQVAGVIAMAANNGKCGVGIAYNAKITGLKAEFGYKDSTDLQHASGLGHKNDEIDIYSNSWSNDNDGTRLVERQELTYETIKKAANEGRQGRGNVFVFSAGNHRTFDTCASDSLTANPHVIVVSAADQRGRVAPYSERCAAVMVAAYAGGGYWTDQLVSTEGGKVCGARFSGTSASAPAVSAIIALALEANPSLTYRDVMHLIAVSAEVAPLADNAGSWRKNGAGFWVSDDFGFGLANAENMVRLAEGWTNVSPRTTCVAHAEKKEVGFGLNSTIKIKIETDGCQQESNAVYFLEHVELESTIHHSGGRGRIRIKLISPQGTNTTLMETRITDNNKYFNKWNILSVQNWGEDPKGTWIVEVTDKGFHEGQNFTRQAKSFTLTLHGTASRPVQLPRTYTGFRLPDGTTSWDF